MAKARGTAGWKCKLLIGATAVGEARDVNITLERGEVDVTSYETDGWADYAAGLARWGGDFTLYYKMPATQAATTLFSAFIEGTVVENVSFLREDGSGFKGDIVVTNFSEERPFEGAVARRIQFRGAGIPEQLSASTNP